MGFQLKPTKHKVSTVYKSLYIREELAKQVEQIAKDNDTSFNNVVISMIEHCLSEGDQEKTKNENQDSEG